MTSQEQRILQRLIDAHGQWVSAMELVVIANQYSSRIFGLRRAGYRIQNKVEKHGSQKRGFFRLPIWISVEGGELKSTPARDTQKPIAPPKAKPEPTEPEAALFDLTRKHQDDG